MNAASVVHPGAVGAEKFWSVSVYGEPERFGALSIYSYETAGAPYYLILSGNARKPVAHYRARSVESREKAIAEAKDAEIRRIEFKAARKAQRATAKNAPNPFKVGDVLYRSWGYDQTNVDFVEVVEVLARSVRVRTIGSEMIDGGGAAMAGRCRPVRGSFAVGESSRLLRLSIATYTGEPKVTGAGEFSIADRESYYCSWYA